MRQTPVDAICHSTGHSVPFGVPLGSTCVAILITTTILGVVRPMSGAQGPNPTVLFAG